MAFTTPLHHRATVENVTSRRLMLDMDLTLRRAQDTRRWVLKTDTAGWLYRRVHGGQEITGDVADYPSAVAKRLEWETEIARSRVEGWH
jgi:hypothetical protein